MISHIVLAFIAWLVSQGIPCTGYTEITGNGTTPWPPAAIKLTFDKSATQSQINQAYDLVDDFVYVPKPGDIGVPVANPEAFREAIDKSALGARASIAAYALSQSKDPKGLWAKMLQDGYLMLNDAQQTAIEAAAQEAHLEIK